MQAYCKLHTCYEMCDGGRPSEAFAGKGTNGVSTNGVAAIVYVF